MGFAKKPYPIRVIEWSGDTRGNGKGNGWELLHTLIVGAALEWCK
jgi:hypothetical protein